MNNAFEEVAMAIFKKPFSDCSLNELMQTANQYPYFGPAHLLLAKKLQEEDSSSFDEQVQRTSLYFQNRLWLQYLLNGEKNGTIIENKQETGETSAEEQGSIAPVLTGETMPAEQTMIPDPMTNPMNKEITDESLTQDMKEPVVIDAGNEVSPSTEMAPELPRLKIEPLAPGAELSFEPYHTVDYFASQGIKFREEEKPKDLFSQQLRSFTEWLKTMKRIPPAEITVTIDAGHEKKIEQLAEHSIAERHVITEAMAEVWEKQGNKARAEEIYRKLSLLDPSKSSYFAAKIEELKKTS